jgi:hypothetical protein
MSNSLTERVTALERVIAQQQELLNKIIAISDIENFVNTSKASKALGISVVTIRDRIKHAKAFPKESKYKQGIHWKQVQTTARADGKEPSYRYLVNISEWEKVS